MNSSLSRRAWLALACAGGSGLLAACGSGSVVSDLKPARFLTVGDAFMDVGQNGYRFTVNDGSLNWVQQLAAHYDLVVSAATSGGWGYAQGHAMVEAEDSTSGTQAPSVAAQIDTLLARTTFDAGSDVVMVGGGIADIVHAVNTSGISDTTTATVRAAGTALGQQVRRLRAAGARHIVAMGVYNLGHTPWARGLGLESEVSALSTDFNSALLLELSTIIDNTVQTLDPAQFFNLMFNNRRGFPLDNERDPVCTTPDATTCTTDTLLPGVDYNRYLWADGLHLTPAAQRMFASESHSGNALSVFRRRW
ncbi:MAG: SGNH/GDSL hydrolase family protein [Pseudomonadota bacterium]|nr:SGNH/GDSL hydrolase family protein [Pseudomonadota bacterium]